jgi:hypothetical protein
MTQNRKLSNQNNSSLLENKDISTANASSIYKTTVNKANTSAISTGKVVDA